MVIQDYSCSALKPCYCLLFALKDSPHFDLPFCHIFAYLFQRLFLPFDQIEAKFSDFCEIRPKIFPEPLFIALNPIISKIFLLNPLVLPLIILIADQLLPQLFNQQRLYLESFLTSFQLLIPNAITPIVEEPVIRVDFELIDRFPE